MDGEQATPSFSRYADAITRGLMALEYPSADKPIIVLEAGRALVDSAGYLITSVVANKRNPEGQRALVLDAGVNLLFTALWYHHAVAPVQSTSGNAELTTLYGPLCMNIDVMRESVRLPPLSAGDLLVFRNAGAYNMTQWMQFITLRPAAVMIGCAGEVGLIRRAEMLNDLRSLERVPQWLG